MELLSMEGKITEKIYGKQKIYFANQVGLLIEKNNNYKMSIRNFQIG